jgi:hypothetical protein
MIHLEPHGPVTIITRNDKIPKNTSIYRGLGHLERTVD